MTDYYATLGLERGASETDIRRAFRRLALLHHPDRNNGDSFAADRFRALVDAYEALTDPRRRPQMARPRSRPSPRWTPPAERTTPPVPRDLPSSASVAALMLALVAVAFEWNALAAALQPGPEPTLRLFEVLLGLVVDVSAWARGDAELRRRRHARALRALLGPEALRPSRRSETFAALALAVARVALLSAPLAFFTLGLH